MYDMNSILQALLADEEEVAPRKYGAFERMMMGQPGPDSYEEGGGRYMPMPARSRGMGGSKDWERYINEMRKWGEWKKQKEKAWEWWSQL